MSNRPIHIAAKDGNLEEVKKCIEQDGEHINVKGEVSYSLWFNLYRFCFSNLLIHVDNYI